MLSVEKVSKRFGEVRALRDVSIDFHAGEIHAVLGENGAGKSTLVSVVSGFVVHDSGTIDFQGVPGGAFPVGRPHDTRRLGIRMVHQHFMMVPELSVAENFVLGTLENLSGRFQEQVAFDELDEVAKRLGWEIGHSKRVADLPVGVQQRLEIIKCLAGEAKVLILDEPTAVLSPQETEELFEVLRNLKDSGVCVILIAHKLSEVMSVADRISVLRRGELVTTVEAARAEERQLAEWMVGEVPALRSSLEPSQRAAVVSVNELQVNGARGEPAVQGVTFEVRSGEVLGIGGVDGNGQIELVEALVGLRKACGGDVRWTGERRVAYIPQDRHGQALALEMSVLENVLIGQIQGGSAWRHGFLDSRALRKHVESLVEEYDIRLGGLDDPVRSLSGGNQQKLVVSRALSTDPNLIVAHNPTRGLDVKAAAYVESRLLAAAQSGAAVLLVSTDLDELASISSRSFFIKKGRLFEGGSEAMVG